MFEVAAFSVSMLGEGGRFFMRVVGGRGGDLEAS